MPLGRLPVIVTVVPIPIQNDSRGLKQASTLGRSGYQSVVIEIGKSDLSELAPPFHLISISSPSYLVPSQRATSAYNLTGSQGATSSVSGIKKLLANVIDLNRFIAHLMLYILRDVALVALKAPRADLYYLHAPYHFLAVYILSRFYGVPYVYDAHDFYSNLYPSHMLSSYERNWRQPFHKTVERLCARRAAAVVTVSSGLADLLQQEFQCQPIVIRNVHDLRIDRPVTSGIKQHLGLSDNCLLLVVVGQAKQGRAVHEAITALADLPDHVHLAVLGRGYDHLLRDVTDASLARRVHIVPPVKPYEVVPFIREADAALLLYYALTVDFEIALPNGLFQSIAAGLPLLYPGLREISRIAEEYQLGLPIIPQSPSSISRAVVELLKDPERLDTYRQNAQIASQELNWEQEEKALLELIKDCINEVV